MVEGSPFVAEKFAGIGDTAVVADRDDRDNYIKRFAWAGGSVGGRESIGDGLVFPFGGGQSLGEIGSV